MGKNKFKKPNQQLQNNQNIVTNQVEPILQQSINLVWIPEETHKEYLYLKKRNSELHLRILELSSNEKILNEMKKISST
jgi:hypothetical protein